MLADFSALVRRSIRTATPMARAQAEGSMNAVLAVMRPSEPVFNRATGAFDSLEETPRYEGKGSITIVAGPQQLGLGEEQTFFSNGRAHIPLSAPRPQVDDLVKVVDHPDQSLVGRLFRVLDVAAGGEIPTAYAMQISGAQPGPNWRDERPDTWSRP